MSMVWLNKPLQRANAQADDVPPGTEEDDLALQTRPWGSEAEINRTPNLGAKCLREALPPPPPPLRRLLAI